MSEVAAEEAPQRPTQQEVEETLLGGRRRYTGREIAELAGVSFTYAQRIWRAMGFAEVPDGEAAFTDGDLASLRRAAQLIQTGLLDEDLGVRLARALGQSMGRLAEWQANTLVEQVATPGEAVPDESMRSAVNVAEHLVPEFEALVVQMWRRQLAASGQRAFAAVDAGRTPNRVPLAVGFVDASFTPFYERFGREPDEEEQFTLLDSFEVAAADAVAGLGGRVVKTLGKELLFVADTAVAAAEAALRLTEAVAGDGQPVEVRVGVSYGTALLRFGDVSGTTVELASRLTSRARPGSVLVDCEVAGTLKEAEGYEVAGMAQSSARGYGTVQPYSVSRAGDVADLDGPAGSSTAGSTGAYRETPANPDGWQGSPSQNGDARSDDAAADGAGDRSAYDPAHEAVAPRGE